MPHEKASGRKRGHAACSERELRFARRYVRQRTADPGAGGDNNASRRPGFIEIPLSKEPPMTNMLKVIEVIAESNKSWEDAAAGAVARAGKTLKGIKSIYIKDFQAKVENNKIVMYRINANISFMLE
jgi:hypothetical protein